MKLNMIKLDMISDDDMRTWVEMVVREAQGEIVDVEAEEINSEPLTELE